jgi:large subunit ribosomal protein L9
MGGHHEIDRHRIQLERPIKESGPQEIIIKLHPEVNATLHITVKSKGAAEGESEDTAAREESEERPAGGFKAKAKARHQA